MWSHNSVLLAYHANDIINKHCTQLLNAGCGQLFVAGDNSFGQLGLGQHVPATQGLVQLQLLDCLQQELLATNQSSNVAAVRCQTSISADAASTASRRWCIADVAAGMRHSLVLLQLICGQQAEQQESALSVVAGFGSNKRQQLGCTAGGSHAGTCRSQACEPAAAVESTPAITSTVQGGVAWLPCLAESLNDLHISMLSAGGERSAAVTRQGQLLLWGRPLSGWDPAQLSYGGPSTDHATVFCGRMASSGCHHTCIPQPAVKADWLLSNSSAARQQLQWVDVRLGWRHMVALDSAGQVWTAGDNSLGQLGVGVRVGQEHQHDSKSRGRQNAQDVGPQLQQQQQTVAAALAAVAQAAAASAQPACDAQMSCGWGLQQQVSTLNLVPLPTSAVTVAAGAEHCAAVLGDGSLYTWGWGEHGQLGKGSTANAQHPQNVKTAWHAAGVACGSGFTVVWGAAERYQHQ